MRRPRGDATGSSRRRRLRDPIGLLEAEAATRIEELLPIRYGRMLDSPLAFYRGSATVMANDLAATPQAGLHVQLCGDAHLMNFGGFASPERDLVFDVNDFDETLPGPFEWDVKRLAASVEIAGRDRGLARAEVTEAVLRCVRAYRETMLELAQLGNLAVRYSHADAGSLEEELRDRRDLAGIETLVSTRARAESHDAAHDLARLTRLVDGEPRFVAQPPLLVPVAGIPDPGSDLEETLRTIYAKYRASLRCDRRRLLESFRLCDLARKVVGVGSVGTQCWVFLLVGRDERDPLFLQLKEAQPSVLEGLLGPSEFGNNGRRVVEGQLLSQAVSDIFLGWTRATDSDGVERAFYVRQLRDWKVSVDLNRLDPEGLSTYARWCAEALARAHARSGDRIAIAAYLGKNDTFDRAVTAFSSSYADLNGRDHASLRRAVEDGRIIAA